MTFNWQTAAMVTSGLALLYLAHEDSKNDKGDSGQGFGIVATVIAGVLTLEIEELFKEHRKNSAKIASLESRFSSDDEDEEADV